MAEDPKKSADDTKPDATKTEATKPDATKTEATKTGNSTWFAFNIFLIFLLAIVIGAFAKEHVINTLTKGGWFLILFIVLIMGVYFFAKKSSKEPTTENFWASISSILIIIIMTISGLFAIPGINYVLVFFSLFLFMLVLGILVNSRLTGILIDERNQMSLSRFQLVLWTLIILSAFLTIALSRIGANVSDPTNIALPETLWVLLGISTASLVGTPLILAEKKNKNPANNEDGIHNVGIVAKNPETEDAAFSDMFKGDEIDTAKNINMAKVQMFFFTIIVALSYGVVLYSFIANPSNIKATQVVFPALTASIIAILGISNAGYLTNKATDQTPVDSTSN